MSRLDGKVALVTGGRSGIGAAIAERLVDEGATVWTAQRGADGARGIEVDLADATAPARLIHSVIDRSGRLDLLVNNAGVMPQATVAEMALADWEDTLRVNLTAPFLLIQAALSHLVRSRGSIINVGSIEGLAANPEHAAYGASKAGLHALTRAVAVDHGAEGVRCNAVAPGWIDTELNRDFVASRPDPERVREGLADIHPAGRTGLPAEVASLVVFLASEDAAFITGQVYSVDGGRMAQLSLPR